MVSMAGHFFPTPRPPLAVYDREKCLEILCKRDGVTYEEAEECFSFNTEGAWLGPNTPLVLTRAR